MIDFEKMASEAARQAGSLVNSKEMTELFGLSKGRVSQLTSEGVFIRNGEGYDLKASVKNYLRLAKTAAASAPLIKARIARAEADARKARVEADLAESVAVKIDVIETAIAEIGASVRGALLTFRNTLPERLAGLDAEKIAAVLDEEIRRVMGLIYKSHLTSGGGYHDDRANRSAGHPLRCNAKDDLPLDRGRS
jgi:phage terminase Nu1 subunit (DNA packaging protein)